MRGLGIKSSSVNASNPFAEREVTLSQIDSMWQNGEITGDQARDMAISMATHSKYIGASEVLPAVLQKR